MTQHAEVATSRRRQGGDPGACRARRAASAIRPCATAAPSAARSRTTIPSADYPAACLGARRRRSSPTSARSRRTSSSRACSRRRSRRARSSPRCRSRSRRRRLHEVPPPGLALRLGRRVRREALGRDPRRRDGRRRQRRLPLGRGRGGARASASCRKSLDGLTASQDGLNSDIHADADYRAHLIGVMARRAVKAATVER